MRPGMKGRFLRDERGFTLMEMMITTIIFMIVLFALYGVFDMSITAFRVGNNKVEAVEGARLGLEKMEREIRQAYAFNRGATPTPDTRLFEIWTPTQIRFGNDLDGDGKSGPTAGECPNINACERISYSVDPATGTLMRTSGGFAPQPMVEDVDYVSPTNTGLSFQYFQLDGTTEVVPGVGNEADVGTVRIQLRIRVDGGNVQDSIQTLTTDVALRNRSG
jgi:prepilin-type N-terminal cleavage/methylation domain-containing protein